MKDKVAKLTIKEVEWVDDKPLKYQAVIEYPVSDERTIRLLSSPMSSKTQALEDIYKELMLWDEAIAAFKNMVTNKEDKDGKDNN
jgi:hypothetical protein